LPPYSICFSPFSLFPPSLRFQPQNDEGKTALYKAAFRGFTEVVKFLITEGNAEVNKADNDGRTPLWMAASKGNAEIAALLVKEGADVSITAKGFTPLTIARALNHEAIVALLEQ
jgi:ankyrin repeat protein